MGYQSKTYSLSDEVVEEIEKKREGGVSPDRFLWSLIFGQKKPSKREQMVAQLAASDVTAQAVGGRPDVEYGSSETVPRGQHVTSLDATSPAAGSKIGKASTEKIIPQNSEDWRKNRAPLLKPGDKKK